VSAVVAPTTADRLLAALRALIRAELPQLTFLGTYEYSIQAAGSATVDVSPTDTTIPLPTLTGVPLRSSLLGQVVSAQAVGGLALIRFINGDPTRPVCMGITTIPDTAALDATGEIQVGPSATKVVLNGGSLGVARVGDSVTFFLPPGSLVTGTMTPVSGPPVPFTGTLSIVNGMSGIIGSGSPNVGAG
jgi:hypothetical protein